MFYMNWDNGLPSYRGGGIVQFVVSSGKWLVDYTSHYRNPVICEFTKGKNHAYSMTSYVRKLYNPYIDSRSI